MDCVPKFEGHEQLNPRKVRIAVYRDPGEASHHLSSLPLSVYICFITLSHCFLIS